MQEMTNVPVGQEQLVAQDHAALLRDARNAGANWFFWIAGLSLVNLVILLMDVGFYFPVGMAASELPLFLFDLPLALPISAVVLGLCALFGVLTRRGLVIAFFAGMLLYIVDGVVMWLAFEDFIGIGFHLFALWGLFKGARAQMQLNRAARATV